MEAQFVDHLSERTPTTAGDYTEGPEFSDYLNLYKSIRRNQLSSKMHTILIQCVKRNGSVKSSRQIKVMREIIVFTLWKVTLVLSHMRDLDLARDRKQLATKTASPIQ